MQIIKKLIHGRKASPTPSTQLCSSSPTVTDLKPGLGVNAPQPKQNKALQKAIERHLDDLPTGEKDEFLCGVNEITEDLLLSRIKQYDDSHKSRSRTRSHAESVQRVLRCIDRFMASITIATGANPNPASIVVGVARGLLDVAIAFVTFFTRLTDMLSRLADYLGPLAQYTLTDDETVVQHTADAYGDMLQFLRQARRVFLDNGVARRGVSVFTFIRLQWSPFEEEFEGIENSFRHHVRVLHEYANAAQLKISQEIMSSILSAVWEKKTDNFGIEKQQFLRWLVAPDFEARHLDNYDKKHPGTAEWIICTNEYTRWSRQTGPALLWRYGQPGVGKSVITSNITEHICNENALSDGIGIAYIYYDYRHESLGDHRRVILSVLKQLCRQVAVIPESLLSYMRESRDPVSVATKEYYSLITGHFNQVILIIDALDECP
ncbi:hypothetical protein BO78DRAFT_413691 [Aspergillus sclerotiicarbonarius CBS 121057]|uniref:Nephrocystin 3-like N-terminal domain-containing protein n=1 Tax=Aspergillus sclerotiicarbonarius (strain CBS 121057 / IBT 28362) TaxID=1448318 RepID=A0A319F5V6_ASPSB|nr:hypothetical protein BO78DRAFT_413691 [Aspergillus sclerotiicarbonarius CBS 121057]